MRSIMWEPMTSKIVADADVKESTEDPKGK